MISLVLTALLAISIFACNQVLAARHYAGRSGYWPFILIDAAAFTILVLALGGLWA